MEKETFIVYGWDIPKEWEDDRTIIVLNLEEKDAQALYYFLDASLMSGNIPESSAFGMVADKIRSDLTRLLYLE